MSKLDNICAYTHNTLKLYCELFNGVTYGKEKTFFNEKLLTHPLLIPYNYLNDFEKSKDNLVNFLVIEFDNFIKNKTKNCFELFF